MGEHYSFRKVLKNQRVAHQMAEEVKALAVNCDCKSLITGALSLWKGRKNSQVVLWPPQYPVAHTHEN